MASPNRRISTVTTAAILLFVTGLTVSGVGGALGAPVSSHRAGSDPVVGGPWSGYGVRTTAASSPIQAMVGSWIEPGVPCPTVGYASEVIETGLDHYGKRIDGVGSLILCVLGTPVYFTFVDQAPGVATILPLAVHVGDIMAANVSTTYYSLYDVTTATGVSGSWSPVLSLTLAHNSAECVVARGPSLGIVPSLFNHLPTASPTTLSARVIFGSLYTGSPGCAYQDFATGSFNGIGTFPAPYMGYTFKLSNPPPAGTFITPGPLGSGFLPLDSFVVP